MTFGEKEKDRVKIQAGEDTVIFLQNWKSKVRRYRVYRGCLYGALSLCFMMLAWAGYYTVDSNIPSVIHVRADSEQAFHLGVPAKGEIVSVGMQGESNIPKGAVTVDLNQPVTLRTGAPDTYSMRVRLFGILPFKQVDIQVIEDMELVPVGVPVGIYMKADGILVVGVGEFAGQDGRRYSPAKYILHSGDYVRALNGQDISDKNSFIAAIEECGGSEQILTVDRQGEVIELGVKPELDINGKYKIGVWVRDNVQGVGTMTYIDGNGNFGALGHGINDVDTSTLMQIDDGTLYQTEIVSIKKGSNGEPGEMTGMIVYAEDRILGDITYNGSEGIFGVCNQKAMKLAEEAPIPIGLKQEIRKGAARILCTVDGSPRYYDVEITDLHLDHDNINRGIELKITDAKLLEMTGGIVQGMSGAPIIQDGKLVGAVTHVLVQDSTRGYGIFIENMLEH